MDDAAVEILARLQGWDVVGDVRGTGDRLTVEEGLGRRILEGIGRVPDQVSQDIERTLELAMAGIDAFAEEQRTLLAPLAQEGDGPSLMAV